MVVSNTNRSDKLSLINQFLAQAISEIFQVKEFRSAEVVEEVTLTGGTQSLQLSGTPQQVLSVQMIFGVLSRELWFKDKKWILNKFPNLSNTITTRPTYCYADGSTIYFVGLANQDYTIRVHYYKIPTFSLDTDVCPTPIIENAVVAWATASTFRSIQMFQEAGVWMQEYGRALRIAMSSDDKSHADRTAEGHGYPKPWPLGVPYQDPFAGIRGEETR
jgi:hypothetical protein